MFTHVWFPEPWFPDPAFPGQDVYIATPPSDNLGHTPVGVDQPPGMGGDYPFLVPQSDLYQLFGDFYISYTDDEELLALPFRLSYVTNLSGASPAAYDVVVVDANAQPVLDTAAQVAASARTSSAWGNRLAVVTWNGPTFVCRATFFTAWSPQETPHTYANSIEPADGRLDPRTCNRLPLRLRSLAVGDAPLLRGAVQLVAGYNCSLSAGSTASSPITPALIRPTADGGRAVTQITLTAVPGAGLGALGGCASATDAIRTINGIGPDAGGNFRLDASGCLRIQAAERLTGVYGGRLARPAGSSILDFADDCQACCQCDYYARTYKGLLRLWGEGQTLALEAQGVRNLYQVNVARWEAQKACREASPATLTVIPEMGAKATVGGSLCNVTGTCLAPVLLRFTVLTTEVASLTAGPQALVTGSPAAGEQPQPIAGTSPVFDIYLDYANPGDVSTARFRLCAVVAGAGPVAAVTLTVHAPDPPSGASLPVATPPSAVTAAWGTPPPYPVRYVTSLTALLNPTDPFLGGPAC